jgi:DNA polymerase III subunit alpha
VTVGGIISAVRITVAKRGKSAGRKMAIVEVAGMAGSVTALVFPDTYERSKEFLEEDRIVLVAGALDLGSDRPSIKANDVRPLDGVLGGASGGQLVIDLAMRAEAERALERVRATLSRHRGSSPVFFRIAQPGKAPLVHRVAPDHFVQLGDDLVEAIENELGPGSASMR